MVSRAVVSSAMMSKAALLVERCSLAPRPCPCPVPLPCAPALCRRQRVLNRALPAGVRSFRRCAGMAEPARGPGGAARGTYG